MLNINTRYERVAPNGDVSIVRVNNTEEQKYHQELVGSGFIYKEIRVSAPVDNGCQACEA